MEKVGKVGRNQACPCGSEKKSKHCCDGVPAPQIAPEPPKLRYNNALGDRTTKRIEKDRKLNSITKKDKLPAKQLNCNEAVSAILVKTATNEDVRTFRASIQELLIIMSFMDETATIEMSEYKAREQSLANRLVEATKAKKILEEQLDRIVYERLKHDFDCGDFDCRATVGTFKFFLKDIDSYKEDAPDSTLQSDQEEIQVDHLEAESTEDGNQSIQEEQQRTDSLRPCQKQKLHMSI